MEAARELWGVARFDLMQIHNMLDWPGHLETLKAWKAEGRIRYIGITTSHGRRHEELERALAKEPFDFVQFTYNLVDRAVELGPPPARRAGARCSARCAASRCPPGRQSSIARTGRSSFSSSLFPIR